MKNNQTLAATSEPTRFAIETEQQLLVDACKNTSIEYWSGEMHTAWAKHIDPQVIEASKPVTTAGDVLRALRARAKAKSAIAS